MREAPLHPSGFAAQLLPRRGEGLWSSHAPVRARPDQHRLRSLASVSLAAQVGGDFDHHGRLRLHRLGGQPGGVRPAEAGGAQPRRLLEGDAEARPAEGAAGGDDHRPGAGGYGVMSKNLKY